MKAIIYTRVSSKKQAQASGPIRQEEDCQMFCEKRGWEVLGIYHEIGRPGDTWESLPVLYQLVKHVLPAHQPVVLVVEEYRCVLVSNQRSLEAAVRQAGSMIVTADQDRPYHQEFQQRVETLFAHLTPEEQYRLLKAFEPADEDEG